MHSKRGIILVLASAVFASAMTGCVKKRDEQQSQGMDKDAWQELTANNGLQTWKPMSDDNSAMLTKRSEFTLNTGAVIKNSKNTEAELLNLEEGVDYVTHFDIVSYATNDPYLAGTDQIAEMLGEENKVYGIAYDLTPDFLILNKVVKSSEMSTTEMTYARQEGNEWIVPIGGYTITGFFNVERMLDLDGRPTNRIIEVPVIKEKFKTAQHFKIDPNSFTKFDRQEKADVLPKTFFDPEAEWYFSETTVEARLDGGTIVGDLGGFDTSFSTATRIKFRIQGTNLVGLNTNVDEEFKKEDTNLLNFDIAVKIPLEQIDYRRLTIGNTVMRETVDSIKRLEDRRFVKLDFLRSETPKGVYATLLDSIFNQINNFKILMDVTYGEGYLSFSVKDAETGSIRRYSFRKIDPAQMITPRRAFVEDNRIFGTFTSAKSKKLDYLVNQKEDLEKLILMARHNPDKDIVYFFTEQTPKDDWHRNIGREAVNLWTQAFQMAGLNIKMVMDESKDIPLGDIRYNAMNIVRRAGAGLLGYGPSLIDSETGEIVSASMNMGMDNMLEQYYRLIRDYLGRKSGRYYDFRDMSTTTVLPSIFAVFSHVNAGLMSVDPMTGQSTLMVADNTLPLNSARTHLDAASLTDKEKNFLRMIGLSPSAGVKEVYEKVMDLRTHAYRYANLPDLFGSNLFSQFNQGYEFSSTEKSDSIIEKNCPEVVALADQMSKELVTTDVEVPIIEPCVRLFAQSDALTTVLHEIGHNLSMRHNFTASNDEANFPDMRNYKLKYMNIPSDMLISKSSSVMDYLVMEGQQVALGGYDIATVRWIYGGEVEDKNGQIVKVDPARRIQDQMNVADLKHFKYCTDEHASRAIDPMCARHDWGLTAKESVKFRIDQAYNTLAKVYRYDRRFAQAVYINILGYGIGLKQHYDKWRMFLRSHTGPRRGYLQNMSLEEYKQVLRNIEKTPDAQALKDHLEIRNMIVRFLVDVAFISNKYCVVVDADQEERLVELEKIRAELLGFEKYEVVTSCDSPAAKQYLTDRGFTLQKEIGHFLDMGRFDLDPNKFDQPLDFGGTQSVRSMATELLVGRISPSYINQVENFLPNMLDEPDIRQYLQGLFVDRVINGVREPAPTPEATAAMILNERPEGAPELTAEEYLFGQTEIQKLVSRKSYKNFSAEMNLSSAYGILMKIGLIMPGQPDDSRGMALFVGANPNREQVEGRFPNYINIGSTYLYVHDNNSLTGQMMRKYQQLSQQKNSASITPDSLIGAKAAILNAGASVFAKTNDITMFQVLELMDWVGQNQQQLASNPQNMPIVYLLGQTFQAENRILSTVAQLLAGSGMQLEALVQAYLDPNADANLKQTAKSILDQSAAQLYAQLQAQDPTIQVPTAANVQTRMDSIILRYGQEYKSYVKNSDELDAQSEMLLRLLMQLR